MKNMWLEIAKECDVEIGEEFKIEGWNGIYRLENVGGLYVKGSDGYYNGVVPFYTNQFISGNCTVIKIPFIPKMGGKYFRVNDKGLILEDTFYGYSPDLYSLDHGNCYATEEQAKKNIEKHMKQFEEIKQKAGII